MAKYHLELLLSSSSSSFNSNLYFKNTENIENTEDTEDTQNTENAENAENAESKPNALEV